MRGARSRQQERAEPTASHGQSLVEFVILLPLVLLVLLFALDFGRVFLTWVNLNNAVRVGANFAAQNPTNTNWGPGSRYDQLIRADTTGIGVDCALPSTLPAPTFPSGKGIGSPAQVGLTCGFRFITPLIMSLVGGPCPGSTPTDRSCLRVSALAAFPTRSGAIAGVPVEPIPPTPTTTASSSDSPPPTPATCTVPNLANRNTRNAQTIWSGAGFLTNVIFNPLVPPHYVIRTQSLALGSSALCASASITVTP